MYLRWPTKLATCFSCNRNSSANSFEVTHVIVPASKSDSLYILPALEYLLCAAPARDMKSVK